MAMKNWKLRRTSLIHTRYDYKYGNDIIVINQTIIDRNKGKYVVAHIKPNNEYGVKKYFNTKQQALKFAKAYMRKH